MDELQRNETRAAMNSTQAVFLHSGYGATDGWLWSCLRDLDGVMAYDEPLRAMVESVDYAQYASTGSDGPPAAMPCPVERPAADVAEALRLDTPGLSRIEMAFLANQFEEATPEYAGDIEYFLRTLMTQAFDRGRLPVFRFGESLGRLAWMRRAFPDVVHIVVARNPLAQWHACCDRLVAHRDAFSIAMPFLALACGRSVAAVERVVVGLRIDLPDNFSSIGERQPDQCIEFFKANAGYVGPAASYRAFLGCWLLAMRHATTHADAVFDCDLAIRSHAYLSAAEAWIANLTGLTPSLRAAHRNRAQRGRNLSAVDNEDAHLVAMEVGKLLVRDGSAPVDALALWASKLAEATLGTRADADATDAYGKMCVDQALRIVDLAAAGSRQFRLRCGARERARDDEGGVGRVGRAGERAAAGALVEVDEYGAEFLGDAAVGGINRNRRGVSSTKKTRGRKARAQARRSFAGGESVAVRRDGVGCAGTILLILLHQARLRRIDIVRIAALVTRRRVVADRFQLVQLVDQLPMGYRALRMHERIVVALRRRELWRGMRSEAQHEQRGTGEVTGGMFHLRLLGSVGNWPYGGMPTSTSRPRLGTAGYRNGRAKMKQVLYRSTPADAFFSVRIEP